MKKRGRGPKPFSAFELPDARQSALKPFHLLVWSDGTVRPAVMVEHAALDHAALSPRWHNLAHLSGAADHPAPVSAENRCRTTGFTHRFLKHHRNLLFDCRRKTGVPVCRSPASPLRVSPRVIRGLALVYRLPGRLARRKPGKLFRWASRNLVVIYKKLLFFC